MNNLKIGWGREEFSTTEPVSIPGQMHIRVSGGILDPLYVTALCLDGGEGQDSVIFCTIDMTVIRYNILDPIIAAVREKHPEIPESAIVIGATHTHSSVNAGETPEAAPDGQKIYPGHKIREFLIAQAAKAICTAWETRKPGGMAYGYGYAVVAHSRRTVYMDDVSLRKPNAFAPNGHGVMYGDTDDPMFSHFEAGADHFLNAMFTFDEEKKLTGMVVNIPCPSQLSENFRKLSADYWHDIREAVKGEFGENVYVLPQCAAAGDLSPRILHYKQAQARRMHLKYGLNYNVGSTVYAPELVGIPHVNGVIDEGTVRKVMAERKDIAERVLLGLRDIYSWAKKDIQTDVPVKHRMETVNLSRRMITDEEAAWCRETVEKMRDSLPTEGTPAELNYAQSRFNALKGRNTRALDRYEKQNENPTIPMRMHVVRVGEIAFATNRFELYMDFMHRMQARSPVIQTFIVQLAGEENGSYLATERGREDKGYSASLFCNQVSPEGGQEIVENTLRILNELKED